MLLLELNGGQNLNYQDLGDDHSAPKWKESRKTRLTLNAINKIRRMKEIQSYEKALSLKKIRQQYSPPAQGPGL